MSNDSLGNIPLLEHPLFIDGRPRVTRPCKECSSEFQILNHKSKQIICDECKKRILAELPSLKKQLEKLRAEYFVQDAFYYKVRNDLRGQYTEEYRKELRDSLSTQGTVSTTLYKLIEKYRGYFIESYGGDLKAREDQCLHTFDDLVFSSTHYENPPSESRVEYWATLRCRRCDKVLNLYRRAG